MAFARDFEVRWSDVDPNGHVRSSVYWDFCTHVRFRLLEESGFHPARLQELGMGPVVLREAAEYHKEIRMGDPVRVDLRKGGLSPEGDHWRVVHGVYKGEVRAATLTLSGGWLDLRRRRLTLPPPDLAQVLRRLDRAEDYLDLPPLVRP